MRLTRLAVLVPTLNAGLGWNDWVAALRAQSVQPEQVLVLDSESTDDTVSLAREAGFTVERVARQTFSHGGTRQRGVERLAAQVELLVCLTQDAILADSAALAKLLRAFDSSDVAAAFGRQLASPEATPLAAHARWFNYPAQSRKVRLADRDRLGFKVCFLSNSFAAYRMSDLLAVGGFPPQVILGEDASVAGRLLLAGKAVQYVADACVYHSHNYSVAEDFRRYFDTGVFHARERWLLDNFGGASGEGLRYLRSELKFAGWHQLGAVLGHTMAKYAGYRLGRLERWLPLALKRRCSMHKNYWNNAQ